MSLLRVSEFTEPPPRNSVITDYANITRSGSSILHFRWSCVIRRASSSWVVAATRLRCSAVGRARRRPRFYPGRRTRVRWICCTSGKYDELLFFIFVLPFAENGFKIVSPLKSEAHADLAVQRAVDKTAPFRSAGRTGCVLPDIYNPIICCINDSEVKK